MSYCTKCGNKLEENDVYCIKCGAAVGNQIMEVHHDKGDSQKLVENYKSDNYELRERKRNYSKIASGCIIAVVICFILGYIFKDTLYFEYYNYKANNASAEIDKLTFSAKALSYKVDSTSISNYENAINKNMNANTNEVITSLQQNIDKLPKDNYNTMMAAAYRIETKNYITQNKNEDAFKTFIKLKKYGYDYKSDENYKNVMLSLSNSITDNNMTSVKELNDKGIVFGDIDNDGIDEIVQVSHFYYDIPHTDTDMHSYITAYKFNGEKFAKVDTLSIDIINKGSKIFIGKPNKDISAVIIDGYIGMHEGISNGYYLKNGKLQALMSEGIVAIYPVDSKDVNNDGYIEFPCMEVDPNSINQSFGGSDKIITWYKVNDNGETSEVKKEYQKNQ